MLVLMVCFEHEMIDPYITTVHMTRLANNDFELLKFHAVLNVPESWNQEYRINLKYTVRNLW